MNICVGDFCVYDRICGAVCVYVCVFFFFFKIGSDWTMDLGL